MGKPTGFLEYLRELPLDRKAIERIQGLERVSRPHARGKTAGPGARCMDCGIPFCHTGTLLSGMASGCPINNLIPNGTTWSIADSGARPSNGSTRPIIFPSSPAASAPRPAKGPACWASMSRRSPSIDRVHHHRSRLGKRLGGTSPPDASAPENGGGRRVRSGRTLLPPLNSTRRSLGHRVRTGRSRRGPAHVRHPEHETRQKEVVERRHRLMVKEGVDFRTRTEVGKELPRPAVNRGFRCGHPLHRGHKTARPRRRRSWPQGHSFRHGFPHRQHPGPAGRPQEW
jgi:glutamate synthase (NADPH) small chain